MLVQSKYKLITKLYHRKEANLKSETIYMRIEPDIKDKIKSKAKKCRHSLSDYIYRLILKDLKAS